MDYRSSCITISERKAKWERGGRSGGGNELADLTVVAEIVAATDNDGWEA